MGLYIENPKVAKPGISLKWNFGISGICVSAFLLTRIQGTSHKKPQSHKTQIIREVIFQHFGVSGFGNPRRQWFGIESLELPVPGSLK
jgi:hypothetical protein